jgi:hypothetical protein
VDAVVRRRRLLLTAALAALSAAAAVACVRGAGGGPPIGTSDHASAGSGAKEPRDAGFVDGAGSLPLGYRTAFTKLNKERFVSRGHAAGRWEVDVYANELAHKAIAARAREVPVGAVVVEEHFERTDKAAGPVMVMEKRPKGYAPEHGDWRYAVVGSQGQLVKDGVIDSCAGCHDDAPMDGLFPIVD